MVPYVSRPMSENLSVAMALTDPGSLLLGFWSRRRDSVGGESEVASGGPCSLKS